MSDLDDIEVIEITSLEEIDNIDCDPRIQGIVLTNQLYKQYEKLSLNEKRDFLQFFELNLILDRFKILFDRSGFINRKNLFYALQHNMALKELYLSLKVGDLKLLATMLKSNQSIYKLDISNNPYDKEGLLRLSKALKDNSTLIELNVQNTGIHDEEAIYIAYALRTNISLKIINLNDNPISLELLKLIQKMLDVTFDYMKDKDEDIYRQRKQLFKPYENYFLNIKNMKL